ncbi:hypothetical protein SAMN05421782_1041, partial [Listeria ivanovii]
TFISTGYTTLVLTKNTAVNFILYEFNESVFLFFSFFSGSAYFTIFLYVDLIKKFSYSACKKATQVNTNFCFIHSF